MTRGGPTIRLKGCGAVEKFSSLISSDRTLCLHRPSVFGANFVLLALQGADTSLISVVPLSFFFREFAAHKYGMKEIKEGESRAPRFRGPIRRARSRKTSVPHAERHNSPFAY